MMMDLSNSCATNEMELNSRLLADQSSKPENLKTTTTRKTERRTSATKMITMMQQQKCSMEATNSGPIAKINRQALTMLACCSALILLATRSFQTIDAIKLQPGGSHKYHWSGEQFAITCQNTNNIKNVKIRWIGPGDQDISEDKSQDVHAESTGLHSYRLMFMNATAKRDDGRYKCTIGSTDDRNPREVIEFELKVHQSTSFRDTERRLVLLSGRPGVIDCRVEFDPYVLPTSTVSWMRDGQPIEKFNDSNIRVIDWDPMRRSTQLVLSSANKQYDGTYTCRAIAETHELSKISDHHIEVETNYAPVFERATETVWVERMQWPPAFATGLRQTGDEMPTQSALTGSSRVRPAAAAGAGRQKVGGGGDVAYYDDMMQNGDNPQRVLMIELNCTCQANPNASIIWSLASSRFVLSKNNPPHIFELSPTTYSGHNATSTLTIGYYMDPKWQYKDDSYICLASNQVGSAQKSFTVEQGDPPPPLRVAPRRTYDPQTYQFKFTLMGFENGQREVMPPVDAIRIRAESAKDKKHMMTASGLPVPLNHTSSSSTSSSSSSNRSWKSEGSRRRNEPSVQLQLPTTNQGRQQQQQQANQLMNQNYTINLSKLPSGFQRLYLETHNAVGWSPNATYLGEYHIVNGVSSSLFSTGSGTSLQLLALCLLAGLLISSAGGNGGYDDNEHTWRRRNNGARLVAH